MGPAGFAYRIVKTADEAVSNSTTFQNDDVLKLPLASGDSVEFSGMVFVTAENQLPDIKLCFTAPAGSTIRWHGEWFEGGSYGSIDGVISASGVPVTFPVAANTLGAVKFMGIVLAGPTSGQLQLQWAQANSHSTPVKVQAASFINGLKFWRELIMSCS